MLKKNPLGRGNSQPLKNGTSSMYAGYGLGLRVVHMIDSRRLRAGLVLCACVGECNGPVDQTHDSFFFSFILRRTGKNKASAHHTSTYFHSFVVYCFLDALPLHLFMKFYPRLYTHRKSKIDYRRPLTRCTFPLRDNSAPSPSSPRLHPTSFPPHLPRGLEREVERLRSALRCTIATVQQHITSAAPNSPAALLAADIPFNSTARGDLSGNLSETASGGGGGGWPPRARGGSTTSGSTDGVGIPRFSSLVDATHDALYVEAGKSSSSAAVTLPLPGVAVDSNMATVGERGVSSEIPPAPPTENKDVRDDSCLLLPQPEGTWFGRKTGLTPSSPNRNRGDGGGGGNSGRVKGSGSSGGSSGGSRGGSRGGSGRIRESNSFDILSVDNSWPGGSAGDPDRREVAR